MLRKILIRDRSHFYRKHPSLQMPTNNILVLLCWNSITLSANQVLVKWAASIDSWTLYQRLIKDIQNPQSKEQLILTLGALLCYQRLSLPNPNTNQTINRSYLTDFDAILNFKYLNNAQTVFEHMVLSVLRIFWTVRDSEKMRQFLVTVLHISPLDLDPSHENCDQYWTRRVKDGMGHIEAFKLARHENLLGGRGGEEVEEMATFDLENEQESGIPTMDESWVLVGDIDTAR